ncbi:hypothetical protein CP03DC29_1287B, partial [Chlamydia psittaci 03DC29]
LVGHAGLGP